MLIRDAQIVRLVERIGEHYKTNISNRFLRPALLQLALEKQTWDNIETLTMKLEHFRYQGFQLDELYRQILASARFVALARRELLPNLRHRIMGDAGADKVLRDMAINNFNSNLQVFADHVGELYQNLLRIDNFRSKGRRPVHETIPEMIEVGSMLSGV
ncbi:MAG: hypothetical protein FWG77_09830 [Treponema sp.]|nr:hypothetical protein [Treponema sp.]